MTDIKKALQKKQNNQIKSNKPKEVQAMLLAMADQIKMALPEEMSSERFRRVALTAFNENKDLQGCEPVSFIAAMMQSAQLGLEPNTPLGEAYLIPYKGKVSFQVGYQGILALAYRTGYYQTITAREVYDNDEFDLDYGNDVIIHKPLLRGNRGEVYGYYAKYVTKDGGKGILYMSKDDVISHAKKYSKSFNSKISPWQTAFDQMAKKTLIIQLLKYAPKSINSKNLAVATSVDNSVIQGVHMDESKDSINFDYEIIPENIDAETGEIMQDGKEDVKVKEQEDFFGNDFKPVTE
ncbi:MAG: recombinase RecT [Tissierellia bacterium]|nr:recombinase RecT [Tissierellia bacterium]